MKYNEIPVDEDVYICLALGCFRFQAHKESRTFAFDPKPF